MTKTITLFLFASCAAAATAGLGCNSDGTSSGDTSSDDTSTDSTPHDTSFAPGDSDSLSSDAPAENLCGQPEAKCALGSSIECSAIGDPNVVGELAAPCRTDCSGWDTTVCLSPADMPPYGNVTVNLECQYVLDLAQIGDVPYQDAHLATIETATPAFTGDLGGVAFPPSGTYDYEILVLRSEGQSSGQLTITQTGFDAAGARVNPVVQLNLMSDTFETGDDIEICQGQGNIFFIYDFNATAKKPSCFHALSADATVKVELAENLTEVEGGKLQLSSAPIVLYWPAQTPHGNQSETMDAPACTRNGR